MFINKSISIDYGNIPVCLAKFKRNLTNRNFYFVMQFMSKRIFYFETEGVVVCTFWHENLRRCSTLELFSPSGSHMHSTHIPCELFGSNVCIGFGNIERFTYIPEPKTKEAFHYNFNGLKPKISFFSY